MAIRRKLLAEVHHQVVPMMVGSLALALVALISWLHSGYRGYLVWGCAAVVLVAARLANTYAFFKAEQREGERIDPEYWGKRFQVGAYLTAILWGGGGVVILVDPDPYQFFLSMSVCAGYMTGAAVRNHAFRRAAEWHVWLTTMPYLVGCLFYGDRWYIVLTLFLVFNAAAGVVIIRALYQRTVMMLLADEEKSELLAQNEAANAELGAVNRQLTALATTDGLTGLANRRSFDATLEREWRRAVREGGSLALLMLDVDYFKLFNDRFGHQAGDACLCGVADAIARAARRGGDLPARYGGEEFAMVLPETDEDAAIAVAEAVRAGIAMRCIPHPGSPTGILTISIGVAVTLPGRNTDPDALLAAADEALYEAKRAGRDRLHVASSPAERMAAAVG